jgi:hypothetical protein
MEIHTYRWEEDSFSWVNEECICRKYLRSNSSVQIFSSSLHSYACSVK